MDSLVQQLAAALAPLTRRTPYVLYGHSMGAWIAYELVRELQRLNRPLPEHLVVAGRRAPHLPASRSPLYQLPDAELIEAIDQRYGGIPAALLANAELMQIFLPVLRADFELLDTYTWPGGEPLPVPITALAGTEDTTVTVPEVRGWRDYTTADFRLRMVAGGHFFHRDSKDATAAVVSGILRGLRA
jgi:medium-chain acyl-[acyl-carrier-protein] hydrolase